MDEEEVNGEIRNQEEDGEISEIVNYIQQGHPTAVGSLPRGETPTIYRVPKVLRQANEKCYEPLLFSIGPYHHGKEELKSMEEVKFQHLQHLLARNPELELKDYVREIRALEEQARGCYSESIRMGSNEFVGMMVVDGCFLVDMFIRIFELEGQYELWLPYFISHDMLLLENQLPFFILKSICRLACVGEITHQIEILVPYCFGLVSLMPRNDRVDPLDDASYHHLLDWFHDHCLPHPTSSRSSVEDDSVFSSTKRCLLALARVPGRAIASLKALPGVLRRRISSGQVQPPLNPAADRDRELATLREILRGTDRDRDRALARLGEILRGADPDLVLATLAGTLSGGGELPGLIEILRKGTDRDRRPALARLREILRGADRDLVRATLRGDAHVHGILSDCAHIGYTATDRDRELATLIEILRGTDRDQDRELATLREILRGTDRDRDGALASLEEILTGADQDLVLATLAGTLSGGGELAGLREILREGTDRDRDRALARLAEILIGADQDLWRATLARTQTGGGGLRRRRSVSNNPSADQPTTPYSIGSAEELQEAGIVFKRKEEVAGSFLDITFQRNGVIEIPHFYFSDNLHSIFQNLIAYEQCYPEARAFFSGYVREFFTGYASFMDDMINTDKDVQILRRSGILEHGLGSDEELAGLFNQMNKGVFTDPEETHLREERKAINVFCATRWHKWRANLMRNYFYSPWAILSLAAALLLLLLTITQTVFSIYPNV